MQVNSTKTCSKCNQTLSIDNFAFVHKSQGDWRRGDCIKCNSKYKKLIVKPTKRKSQRDRRLITKPIKRKF